jgi:hypothetical protein
MGSERSSWVLFSREQACPVLSRNLLSTREMPLVVSQFRERGFPRKADAVIGPYTKGALLWPQESSSRIPLDRKFRPGMLNLSSIIAVGSGSSHLASITVASFLTCLVVPIYGVSTLSTEDCIHYYCWGGVEGGSEGCARFTSTAPAPLNSPSELCSCPSRLSVNPGRATLYVVCIYET